MRLFFLFPEVLVRYEIGERQEALATLPEVTRILAESVPVGYQWIQSEVAAIQATLLLAEGDAEQALALARLALEKRLGGQSDLTQLVACNQALVGAALAGTGRQEEARDLLDRFGPEALDSGFLTPLNRRLILEARTACGL